MSDNWQEFTVSDLQKEGILLVEDGNHGESRPRQNEFGDGRTAFIRAADMNGGLVQFQDAQRINEVALARIRKGVGKGGDILFSHKGTVGKLALAPLNAPPFVCSPQTTFWRTLDEDRLDRSFLYYYMQSDRFTRQWESRKGETDMADYVSLSAQRELLVPRPHIQQQRALGTALRPLDERIRVNHQLNHTLSSLNRTLFKSLFVDFDPVVAKAEGRKPLGIPNGIANLFPERFIETERGPLPRGWEWKTIKDIARYINGKNFTTGATGTGRLVIRIADLKSGPNSSTVYNDVKAEPQNTAQPGDILFAWSGSLDVYRWFRDEALINQHIFKVLPNELPPWFVYEHLTEAMPFFQAVASDKATTMGHIKREHLEQVDVAVPPKPLLDAVGELMEAPFENALENDRECLSLAALRDTMLPRLFSGEARIADIDRAVESVL